MQKWEYCVVGPIQNLSEWTGDYAGLIYFCPNGKKVIKFKSHFGGRGDDDLGERIANMGLEGWEMITAGTVGGEHFLYFKRPIP